MEVETKNLCSFSCKNRPFAVLCSKYLPTPATTLIDHNLIMELGLKLTDLQCKKISFAGRKLRLLGKISTTVQCIKEGKMFANINLRASVVENLKDVIDSHCIAGQKMAQMLSNDVLRLDDTNSDNDDDHDAVSKGPNLKQDPQCTPSVSSSMSTASPSVSGTPSNTVFHLLFYRMLLLPRQLRPAVHNCWSWMMASLP